MERTLSFHFVVVDSQALGIQGILTIKPFNRIIPSGVWNVAQKLNFDDK